MKRVLIVFPGLRVKNDEGSKHRMNCHINEYKRSGYDVSVLAFCKDALFCTDKKFLNQNAQWIIRPYILPLSKNIILTKILEYYIKIVLAFQTWYKHYDIIQMEILCYRSALCRRSSSYITDIHGDSAHEVKEMRSGKEWFVNYLYHQQKQIVLKSDFCIVVSENLRKQIECNSGCNIRNYAIISCGVDIPRFENAERTKIEGLDLDNRIVLGYSGGFQRWQNFEAMIDLVIRLRELDEKVFLLAFSNSDITPYLNKLNILGSDNYYVKSLLPKEVPSHLKLMDAGMLLRSDMILNRVSSPTKICEYLAAGVPVICTQYSGDYNRSVIHLHNGFVSESTTFNDEELKKLLDWLKSVKKERQNVREQCCQSVLNRTFEVEFADFHSHYLNL